MTDPQPIIGTSVVLVGTFNPSIIHPSWFARFEILPPSDLEGIDDDDKKLVIVSPDFARFSVAWLRVQVTDDHFELSTVEADRVPPLRDAAHNIFSQLSHTPVSAIGINRTAHFPLPPDGWARVRTALAPAEAWADDAAASELTSLSTQIARAAATDPGYTRVTIEPSARIHGGVFLAVNDHHDLTQESDVKEAAPALTVLEQGWDSALSSHDKYTDFVLSLAKLA